MSYKGQNTRGAKSVLELSAYEQARNMAAGVPQHMIHEMERMNLRQMESGPYIYTGNSRQENVDLERGSSAHIRSSTPPPPYEWPPSNIPEPHLQVYNRYEPVKTQIDQFQPFTFQKSSVPGSTLKLEPATLIDELLRLKENWCDVNTLGKLLQCSESEIIGTAEKFGDVFSVMPGSSEGETIIELSPKINICSDYSMDGCHDSKSCTSLHMCKYFIKGWCNAAEKCTYGHKWDTDHNSKVLSKFYLHKTDTQKLHEIVKKSCIGSDAPKICFKYNENSCVKGDRDCFFLHICFDYIKSKGKCSRPNCALNHDIKAPHCVSRLEKHGVSTNETERDIICLLAVSVKPKAGELKKTAHQQKAPQKYTKGPKNTDKSECGSREPKTLDEDRKQSSVKPKPTDQKKGKIQQKTPQKGYKGQFDQKKGKIQQKTPQKGYKGQENVNKSKQSAMKSEKACNESKEKQTVVSQNDEVEITVKYKRQQASAEKISDSKYKKGKKKTRSKGDASSSEGKGVVKKSTGET